MHRRKRYDLSLFQLGLRMLEHFLNEELLYPCSIPCNHLAEKKCTVVKMSTIEVNVLLPEEVLSFARLGKEEIREEMRRLLLLELVGEGKVYYGKAAELLGIGQS